MPNKKHGCPLLLAILVAGCASGRTPVFPTRAKVFDSANQPAAGALVILHPAKGAGQDNDKPRGYVDKDGLVRFTTFQENDGAPAGEYTITIEWRAPKKTPFDPDGEDLLQGRYTDPRASRLRAIVENKEENILPRIELR